MNHINPNYTKKITTLQFTGRSVVDNPSLRDLIITGNRPRAVLQLVPQLAHAATVSDAIMHSVSTSNSVDINCFEIAIHWHIPTANLPLWHLALPNNTSVWMI